jgi:hypothetical protein
MVFVVVYRVLLTSFSLFVSSAMSDSDVIPVTDYIFGPYDGPTFAR